MQRRSFFSLAAASTASLALSPLRALASSPVNIIVPYAPGGTADALARLIAQSLGPKLHAPVVVLNKAGASGVIGERFVAEARADGLTILYDATPFAINPSLQQLPFDPQKDLEPVTMVARTPMLLCVPKASPFKSLQDLIAAAKARPGKLTFGSGGQGTVQYMGAELFCQGAGIKMLHVPYRSGGPALTAIAAGEIDLGFGNLPAVSAQVKGGLMKALAITSPQRNAAFPDVPTIAEAAVPHYQSFEWNGMFAPKGTSREAVEQLRNAVKDVLEMPEVKARFDSLGSTIVASTPDEFRKFLADDFVRWSTTVKNAGIHKE